MRPSLCFLLCGALALGSLITVTAQDHLFPPGAVIDVSTAPYGAKPDDGLDDTKAIQRAITENLGTGRVLYFPAGLYEISDTLVAKDASGHWNARLTFQGQSTSKTIFRLRDHAAGFDDPAKPKVVIITGSTWETGDADDGGGNKAFCNNLFDLTVDTGKGNTGAVGIEYAASNCGAIERVNFRGGGVAAISLKRRIPGPCLIKDVFIEGFDVGIDVGDMQYGITVEHASLKGQRIAAIRTDKNILHLRKIISENTVPALIVTDRDGVATVLDSSFSGGAVDQLAINSEGTLLARNVSVLGYSPSPIRSRVKDISNTALLPIEEAPAYWNSQLSDWEPVGARKEGENDDTAAIQRAIDSGKRTVYFPNTRTYFLSDTVTIRGEVRQILGLGSEISLGAAKEAFSDITKPRPLFRVNTGPLVVDGLFFNAQYPGEVLFENNSPADLVIQHCAGWVGANGHRRSYQNTTAASGKLFLEDVFLPGWKFQKQQVWARQLNSENPDGAGIVPQVSNAGGRLWILGFKTEGPAPFLATIDGGTTELLGAYNYISATNAPKVPASAIPYIVTGGTAALTFTTDNFRDNDYKIYIQDDEKGWAGQELLPRNGNPGDHSFVMPLYRSH
ncbi:hypothetical protein BH09VER1_BH09VER1_20170 [soil metagenome]